MATTYNSPFIGTELKLNINIKPIGSITMDDYDFYVEIYCHTKKVIVIQKKDAIRVDENNYIVLVNSSEIGAGEVKCKVTAYIPDGDFNDGLRTEVVEVITGITIIK